MLNKLIMATAILTMFLSFGWTQSTLQEEFSLVTPAGDTLAGEIAYPNREGKFPAAILIWGSGPHTRDQVISGSPIFKQISEALIAQDIAVMRLDKRGYGNSNGDYRSEDNYTTRDLADDISLAYNYLNQHVVVDTTKVGLIGHSEGSIIASMLAAEDPSIDWLILFGPSAVSGKEIELAQGRVQREKLGMSAEISKAVEQVWERYIDFIISGYKDETLYYQIGRDFLIAHGLDQNDERITPTFIDQLLDAYQTPWYQYFYATDNRIYLEKIKIPVLGVFGGADQHTSVALHLLPFYQALERAQNTQYKIIVLADEDHFFFRFQGNRMEKHQFGEMRMSERFLSSIKNWLRAEYITSPWH